MRTSLSALIATLALVVTACAGASTIEDSSAAAAPSSTPAPSTSFVMFDGSTATLADYQGQPVVVNFWASWCPSCVAEMSAAFKPSQEQLGDRVAFLGLNVQDERGRALQLVEETGVLFDLAEDPVGDLYIDLGGIGMPFTVFIDAAGNIVREHNGPLTHEQLVDIIESDLLQ
jgi:cytochrome c biogenesis protein CcmG/thiol:disulfide interchange protein DsbE